MLCEQKCKSVGCGINLQRRSAYMCVCVCVRASLWARYGLLFYFVCAKHVIWIMMFTNQINKIFKWLTCFFLLFCFFLPLMIESNNKAKWEVCQNEKELENDSNRNQKNILCSFQHLFFIHNLHRVFCCESHPKSLQFNECPFIRPK